MQLRIAKTWPIWLLLLTAAPVSAIDQHVTVGGTSGGGYYGGNPILMFNPSSVTISVGDTVTFTNAGGPHNVDADDGSFRCAEGCDGHGGNGNPSTSNWSASVTFDHAGVFAYHCDNHGMQGMTGSITVQGAAPPTNVPITAGFTGAWYDHTQSGHGILLQVLQNNLLLASWFTFTPDGTQQAWFNGIGTITGDTAVVTATLTTGGRWIPNFDPAAIVNNPWGTLTFTFTDCDHGRVDFASTYPGYGSNHMDLQRLTQTAGIACP